ncbi:MAG: phage tail tube protein [Clostridiales bacterium]|jgi:predicted secreted protein|nr:phage tail protein [Eubacteriales bacterium]MDH7567396.1 phage tail tube protein [Clostridiales bacterium]
MALAGKSGKLMVGTNNVTEIKNWSLDLGLDTIDTTALGDEWKNFIAGLKEWSASAEGSWNVAMDAQGQKALQDAYLSGATVSLKLYVDAAHYYSGEAFISSLSVEDPVDDTVNVSFEFQGTGALSYN